jgi:hypothetical protein
VEQTPEDVAAFLASGRSMVTAFAQSEEMLKKYADSYETRGGGAVYGDDVTQIVYLSNDLQAWMTPERAATISRLRVDV